MIFIRQPAEEFGEFQVEALRIAKWTSILEDADGPWLPGPSVNVPEEMVVHRLKVGRVVRPVGERFFRALDNRKRLEGFELRRVGNLGKIAQNLGAIGALRVLIGEIAFQAQDLSLRALTL